MSSRSRRADDKNQTRGKKSKLTSKTAGFTVSKRNTDSVKLKLSAEDERLVVEEKVPILHPTCVTSNSDLLLKVSYNGRMLCMVPLHRAVAEKSLSYFEAMFRGNNWLESSDKTSNPALYTVQNIDMSHLPHPIDNNLIRQFFSMLYQDSCQLDNDEQREMYRLADFFDHAELRKSLSAKIKEQLNLTNLLDIYNLGPDFKEVCEKYTKENKTVQRSKETASTSRKRKKSSKHCVKRLRTKVIRTILESPTSDSSSSSSVDSDSDLSDATEPLAAVGNLNIPDILDDTTIDLSSGDVGATSSDESIMPAHAYIPAHMVYPSSSSGEFDSD